MDRLTCQNKLTFPPVDVIEIELNKYLNKNKYI